MTSDLELILAYKEGNQQAFELLYKKYKKTVLSIIRESTKEVQLAKDYNQEIWTLVATKIDKFIDGSFSAWLRTVAKNYCIDRHRRATGPRTIKEDLTDDFLYLSDEYQTENDSVEEDLTIMSEGFQFLTELQKKILVLRMNGLSFIDIASKLNVPLTNVLSNNRYLTIKLRRHFVNLGYTFNEKLPIKTKKTKDEKSKK
jgi:RNA polymerase sigma-70 factor (ECF subfamily)